MNILLKQPFPQDGGLELPRDFRKAIKEGVNFKITSDYFIKDALNKGPGSWEYDVWLPKITISTYRIIIYGLMCQLDEAKRPWYVKFFEKIKASASRIQKIK